MERAGRLLTKSRDARKLLTPEQMVLAAWPGAVGKRLARRTRAVALRGSTLVVEVEDDLWQRNLLGLEEVLLRNLRQVLEGLTPDRLQFRVAVPRRPPAIESAPFDPELSRIQDPGLRYLYSIARRKAKA